MNVAPPVLSAVLLALVSAMPALAQQTRLAQDTPQTRAGAAPDDDAGLAPDSAAPDAPAPDAAGEGAVAAPPPTAPAGTAQADAPPPTAEQDVDALVKKVRPAPPLPSIEDLDVLAETNKKLARPILRRVARTADDEERRARALTILSEKDPGRATGRICARMLRTDAKSAVRRAAAQCLGRLPEAVASTHTTVLVAALSDDNVDVVTMAGWALSNIGQPEALGALTSSVAHDDTRVGTFFLDYAYRLKERHGLTYKRAKYDREADELRLVPPPVRLVTQMRGLNVTAATGWLGLFGGMTGWLHGGLFVAGYGGGSLSIISPLTAFGGLIVGAVSGATYGFFRADDVVRAHTVVQLGTLGTIGGYGFGALAGVGPETALNMGAFGVAGTLVGVGFGVLLNETRPPSAGALALGAAVAFGSAVGMGGLALGSRFDLQGASGIALLSAGVTGGLTTLAVGPNEIGILPAVGAMVGGSVLAASASAVTGLVEVFQLQQAQFPFTEGSGWAVAGGFATGAVIGSTLTLLAPKSWDPFLAGDFEIDPPAIGAVAERFDARKPVPVALVGGSF